MHGSIGWILAALMMITSTICARAQVTVINTSTGQPPANLSGHDTAPYHVLFDGPSSSSNVTYDIRWASSSNGSIGSITINDIHPDAIARAATSARDVGIE